MLNDPPAHRVENPRAFANRNTGPRLLRDPRLPGGAKRVPGGMLLLLGDRLTILRPRFIAFATAS